MTRFITLPEFWWLAEQVTGINAEVLAKSGGHNLADSALHAPQASFGDQDSSLFWTSTVSCGIPTHPT